MQFGYSWATSKISRQFGVLTEIWDWGALAVMDFSVAKKNNGDRISENEKCQVKTPACQKESDSCEAKKLSVPNYLQIQHYS